MRESSLASRTDKRREKKAAARKKETARKKHVAKESPTKPPRTFRGAYASPALLTACGPLLHCEWSIPSVLEQHLSKAGRLVPDPVVGELLLDTGATRTCISMNAAKALGLKPLRLQKGYGAAGAHEAPVYRVKLNIRITKASMVTELSWEIEAQGIPNLEDSIAPWKLRLRQEDQEARLVGLLGRDILQHTTVLYNGKNGWFEVNFDLDSLRKASAHGQPDVTPPPSSAT